MTLPVSKYEELLETVRSLKHQTIRVRELASPLLDTIINANSGSESSSWNQHQDVEDVALIKERSASTMDSLLVGQRYDDVSGSHHSEPGGGGVGGPWSGERAMWHSEPPRIPCPQGLRTPSDQSVMSFASSSGAAPLDLVLGERGRLDVKVDMVYGLLAALGSGEEPDMADTLLALSANPDSSRAMRHAGCLPVLVQLLHARDPGGKAARALRNLVQGQPDERLRKRELKVLRLLEDIRAHCFNSADEQQQPVAATSDEETMHPTPATENLIKLSFDEGYRHTICELGGIYTLARLLEAEHARHGSAPTSDRCITLRRYSGMALTNLTFGHGRNKALLCAQPAFLRCLVAQLDAQSDELRQVTASVLRNLSWRADAASRAALRQAGVVPALTVAAMRAKREPTLKAILSALWNLSAHCSTNKADICAVPGTLGFLVDMLAWRAPSRTLHIIENAGGILRNVSSHIAVREDYRAVLRERGALPLLLQQLKSPSLTVVANACGTLWNLSAKCERDQRTLWELGAAPMLRSLNHSKHAMIATGSRAALKNLLASRPPNSLFSHMDSTARELGLPALPTLGARKQRALAKDLDNSLAETCDNIEPTSPPPPVASSQPSPVNPTQQLVESLDKLSLRDCAFELEQPVDYSVKYAEPKPSYAETDLDQEQNQPTNYSLRYAETENDVEQEEPDTIKTYCTEGTPYETPRNFSTATSMSDLRQVSTKPETELPPEKKLHSGILTPEKPIKYCEEGTPRCISPSPRSSDTKVVTFNTTATTAAEETPLMFSRCSSLGSLSSAEQHSIHDDRSSVISDFSRLTSGVVSPSELPDSPTQTVPPSPRTRKAPVEVPVHATPVHSVPTQPRSVFEDNVIKFKEVNTPAEFSVNTSLSALTIDDDPPPSQPAPIASTPTPKSEPADLVIDADADIDEQAEDDMLAACINIGMQDNRLRQKKQDSPVQKRTGIPVKAASSAIMGPAPDCTRTYCTEDTPAGLSHAGSRSDLSALSIGGDHEPALTDDSSNPSGDEDLLAQCIQSGMPAAKPDTRALHQRIIKSVAQKSPLEMPGNTTSMHLSSETRNVFTERNTTVEFSNNANLDNRPSSQSVPVVSTSASNSEPVDVIADTDPDIDEQAENDMLAACINIGMQNNRLRQKKQHSSPSPRHRRTGIPVKASPAALMGPTPDSTRTYYTEDTPAVLSHAGSRSDLSAISIGADQKLDLSDESSNLSADEDLLAECIQSGMPPARHGSRILRQRIFKSAAALAPAAARDEINRFAVEDSPCHFSLRSSLSDLTVDREVNNLQPPSRSQPQAVQEPALSRADSMSSLSSIEHAEQALLEQCILSGMPPKSKNAVAAGHIASSPAAPNTGAVVSTDLRNTGYEENLLDGNKKNSPDAVDKCSELLAGSVEDNCSPDASDSERSRNRMLDPDAMIESLDRFTAELVSQSSHLPQHDIKLDNVDTWNEDTSPNDVSFPSLSVSAPLALAASFPSDISVASPDPMTTSTLIALEAARLAADMQLSVELEYTKPPSVMDSLVSLTSSVSDVAHVPEVSVSARNSPVAGRKRSFPAGLLVRRALSHSASNLDHVQPPSIMAGDFLDLVDMENSMISVASITSEIADIKPPEPEHELEPETNTETLCSETDVWEECHGSELTLTEWSDAASASPTPIPSSAENSPRRRGLSRLTPKQRRHLAKERYKTYTVAAEMVIREEFKSQNHQIEPPASPDTTSVIENKSSSSSSYVTAKPTPKERRQADRARFQTRVLRKDGDGEDLHALLAAQAAVVLDTLRAGPATDELLDCETVSLVSNEDDSEHNSVSSVNYRTYHKSWGFSKNLPVVRGDAEKVIPPSLSEQNTAPSPNPSPSHSPSPPPVLPGKPKIVKPDEKSTEVETVESNTVNEADVEQAKAVRGRRKPLYAGASSTTKRQISTSKMITKPIKTMTSNLVKNVTSTLKTNAVSKLTTPKPTNIKKQQTSVSSTNNNNNNKANSLAANKTQIAVPSKIASASTTKSRLTDIKKRPATAPASPAPSRPLERQGTFTKEEKKPRSATSSVESRIPTPGRRTAPLQSRTVSSSATSSRSPSADRVRPRALHSSASSQSLAAKRSSLPAPPPRSNSHVEPTSTTSNTSRTATSRIAGIWKRNNNTNNSTNTNNTTNTVRMRNKTSAATQDPPKRLSRLGSFIQVEEISVT